MSAAVWAVTLPAEWPPAPTAMSFTALRAIEQCPLSWSLSRATYPHLWGERGYPGRAMIGTISGQILHLAMESISSSLVLSEGDSTVESRVVSVLISLGGLTAVLRKAADAVCSSLRTNPRINHRLPELLQLIERELPSLRQRLQVLLSELSPDIRPPTGMLTRRTTQARSSLPNGVHTEVTLRHPILKWVGKADLIYLSDEVCEIVDFKTGDPSDEHQLQLRLYALLWARDRMLNPPGRLASRLRVLYSGRVQDVPPPSERELAQLEQELNARTEAARGAIGRRPPPATPAQGVCDWCDVKHLCSPFWEPETQVQLYGVERPLPCRADLEVRVRERLGASSWKATVTIRSVLRDRSEVLIRANPSDIHFASLIESGQLYRILDAYVLPGSDESSGLPIIRLAPSSELFAVGS